MAAASRDGLLSRYADLLATAPINLVSRRDRGHVRDLHVQDSARIAAALAIPRDGRCLDLGSGGGLPGMVIAMLRPDVQVLCLDARQKKMDFVRSAARELGLANVSVLAARAEAAARRQELRESFDVVVSRAVGSLPVVAELGRGFVRPRGRMVAVKGPSHGDELQALQRVGSLLDIERVDRQQLAGGRDTWLITMVVGRDLPSAIPRRDGVPQHAPLTEAMS